MSGPFAVEAAIAALHCEAARAKDTDWPQIARLYDVLERLQPSPIVSLNRAVAVAMVEGPQINNRKHRTGSGAATRRSPRRNQETDETSKKHHLRQKENWYEHRNEMDPRGPGKRLNAGTGCPL